MSDGNFGLKIGLEGEKEFKKAGIDKDTVDMLFKPRMDFEDKAVKDALKIPHELRLQRVKSDEWKKQVEQSAAIYFEECRSSLMKSPSKK